MKKVVIAAGALLLVALGRPSAAQRCMTYGAPAYFGVPYVYGAPYVTPPPVPYPLYGYGAYPYYPYPLPPAPSLGFGRGGIYGHIFVGRGEGITSYTLPGRDY